MSDENTNYTTLEHNRSNNNKILLCKLVETIPKIYFFGFTITILYYIISMNNSLDDLTNILTSTLNSAKIELSCLSDNICDDPFLGQILCSNCTG